ncbi:hypothetical protein, partial [Parachryseolinea silvisoli]|uniref:hypothetical protein n=1 Tax=Parachryseolinea silvisoli TaxID=2873601 RepID=UPI002265ED73
MIKRLQAGRLSLIIILTCLLVSIRSFGQTNVVPDAVELAALKDLYTSLNGDSWTPTRRTNWPTLATWPATATSAVMDSWSGIVVR